MLRVVRPSWPVLTALVAPVVVLAGVAAPARAGTDDLGPRGMTRFADVITFADFDGSSGAGGHGRQLWRTDGTSGGTVRFTDVAGDPFPVSVVGGTLYIDVLDASGHRELWKSDATLDGTALVRDMGTSAIGISALGSAGSDLMFTIKPQGASVLQLWRSDGSGANTDFVTTVGQTVWSHAVLAGTTYFIADDGTHGFELWKSDGTALGTKRVTNIDGGPGDGVTRPGLTVWNGRLYFNADDGVHGDELWSSDGTLAGTDMVKDIRPGTGSSFAGEFTPMGSFMLLLASDGVHGQELWRTDGTGPGTRIVKDITPGNRLTSQIRDITRIGKKAVFEGRRGLYRTNGTGLGTQAVWPSNDGGPCCLSDLTHVPGEGVLFAGNGPAPFPGSELWRTNGYRGGTRQVEDIDPGTGSSRPADIHVLPTGGAVFTADDGTHGIELWSVLPGVSGAHLVKDITPGP